MHKLNEPWTGHVVGRMHTYGIKGEELAIKCGYTPQYLSMILNGKKKFTSNEAKLNAKKVILEGLTEIEKEVYYERLHN